MVDTSGQDEQISPRTRGPRERPSSLTADVPKVKVFLPHVYRNFCPPPLPAPSANAHHNPQSTPRIRQRPTRKASPTPRHDMVNIILLRSPPTHHSSCRQRHSPVLQAQPQVLCYQLLRAQRCQLAAVVGGVREAMEKHPRTPLPVETEMGVLRRREGKS